MTKEDMESKPDWKDAPSWAESLGMDVRGFSPEFGQWCWCSNPAPVGFIYIERRP
jgi:hypothetical protein